MTLSLISDPAGPRLALLLDAASAELHALERSGIFPARLCVHPEVHALITTLRAAELAEGGDLLVLGTELVADTTVDRDRFALV
jgi:hypothetical protein